MAYLEYFDVRRLSLQEELAQHPDLCELVAKHPPQQFELRLAEIAAYCDVLLDGEYTEEEISNLCEILTRKLYSKRTMIIL